jgi:hypothetical protein
MTTQTETLEAPKGDDGKPAKAPGAGGGLLLDFGVTLIVVVILSWLAGIALNRGFGVHVPLMAGAILLGAGLAVVKMAVAEVAQAWHTQRIKADITLMAAALAVQESARQESADGLDRLLAKLDKAADTDNGGYL